MSDRPNAGVDVNDLERWMAAHDDGERMLARLPIRPSLSGATPEGRAALASLFGGGKGPILATSDVERHNRIKTSGRYVAPPTADAPKGETVPQIWPTLAGQQVNNRGNRISVNTSTVATGTSISLPVLQILSRGADAQMLTVMLGYGLSFPPQVTGGGAFETQVFADLRWGTGNMFYAAQLDWLAGTMLSLPATFLSVNAIVPGNANAVGPKANLPDFQLGAGLAYGGVAYHRNRVKLTVELGNFAGGAAGATTQAVDIPPFAVGVGIVENANVGTAPPVPLYLSTFGASHGAAFVYASGDNFGFQESAMFPIRNGVDKAQVFVPPGVTVNDLALLFELAF